jgi:hypothetical protein
MSDIASANRFCVRRIQITDVRYREMCDSRGRCPTLFLPYVDFYFGKSTALFEIQRLKKV